MVRRHLVLLGDSILDNAPYTTPKPDTAAHLRRLIGERWTVELLARDGSRMADMNEQIVRIDRPATAVLSIGGNDATRHVGMLGKPATSAREVIGELLSIADDFAPRYAAVLDALIPGISADSRAARSRRAPVAPASGAAHRARSRRTARSRSDR